MLVKGDKIVLVKPMGAFTNVGEVCEVISNVDGVINFKFGHGMHLGCMSVEEFEKYFEKYKEPTETFEKGDIVRMIKDEAWLAPMKVGNEYMVEEIVYGVAALHSENENKNYFISQSILNDYFEKVVINKAPSKEDEPISVSSEYIDKLIYNSHISVSTIFDKCTVVACKLPSGFVIVESSACIDPRNYDEKLGADICMKRIKDRVWEMEAYKLQAKVWEDKADYCDKVERCSDCKICSDNGGYCTECYDEDDECDVCSDFNDCEDCEDCCCCGN